MLKKNKRTSYHRCGKRRHGRPHLGYGACHQGKGCTAHPEPFRLRRQWRKLVARGVDWEGV